MFRIVNILAGIFIYLGLFALFVPTIMAQSSANKDFVHDMVYESDTLSALQIKKLKKQKRKQSRIYKFFKSFNETDTTYITPNYYNFTAMLQQTYLINSYSIRGKNSNGDKQRIYFHSKPHLTLGPYIGWHWFFLGYNFDISGTYKSKKTSQFNFSVYSSMFGADFIFQRNNGDFTISKVNGFGKSNDNSINDIKFDGLKTSISSINVYYIFNHKRFSYPAAFSQSTIQKKSCGTWKVGIIYSHQTLDLNYEKLPESLITGEDNNIGIYDELKFDKINYYDYSINFGYAYNCAFAPNFLCAVSLAPAIGYKFAKGESFESKDLLFKRHNLNFDAIGRLGLVWNTNRYFAGMSAVAHAYNYKKSRLSVSNAVAVFNIYCGINFIPKGHYRRSNPQKFKRW